MTYKTRLYTNQCLSKSGSDKIRGKSLRSTKKSYKKNHKWSFEQNGWLYATKPNFLDVNISFYQVCLGSKCGKKFRHRWSSRYIQIDPNK